ncbi:hypothetical protein P4K49_29035 [Bacillus cereus]|uniref:hypothetical protein n=1 Tax=Bacillus thuringiensis TaxID=1428 RepID=UPI000676C3E3|nr:hypothetical protein [Bacillus thuringiensis]MEB8874660.1 hypothetical protein [Bacillus cereus]AKR38951.1 Hypothetical protein NF53_p5198 [Bacillus thuringiensis serovar indiana]MBG9643312.1 hypothetical protein [Bacillus thuringiensis]MBG9649404.1 hypothetical protein [Bacillus thuringiensis]MEB9620145.1 hypothetical protein [Bacillus cereus]
MKKSIEFLILITIFIYINNFSFAYINGYKTLIGVSALWAISPFLFLTIASFILANDYKNDYSIVKKEARVDFALKVISCMVAFYNYKFEIGSMEYIMRFVILVILFIGNMILEYKMYKVAKNYVPKVSNEIKTITEKEKWNIKNYGRAATLGLGSFILVVVGGMNVVYIANINKFYSLISICIFVIFLKMNYDKNNLFHRDKVVGKQIFLRDAFYASLGFGYNLVVAFDIIPSSEMVVNTALIIGVFFLYPTIVTNRKIALKQREVSKVIGDNFDYYYNDDNNPYKKL